MFKKLAIASGVVMAGVLAVAQNTMAAFTVSSSTLATQTSGYLTTVYDYLTSQLSDGGVFLFGVVIVILAIIIHLAWRKLRSVFG